MDLQHGPPQHDILIGQTIGNYLVTQKLGEGGMGSVYLAEHPSIGKKVALKVLHAEFSNNQEVAARFFNEAKAVNDIGHPNIVDIVDFGIIQAASGREQLVYFIMEYLGGMTLSQLVRAEAPLAPERALNIALQVADALSASHKCGIVHRDLKPDNIMLQQRGRERDFVKLLDFGIAKLTNDSAKSQRTRTGIVMGTPAYMSPEQCEGRAQVDQRTDIYALGIVLYEMLTGTVPFRGDGYGEILVQHLTQQPIPPSQFRMMNLHIEAVVMKALEKRADLRYPTMDEFMRAMSDPIGFVEAHGGIQAFKQATLMPSNAPLPAVRLTPPPTTTTPVPGSIPTPYPGFTGHHTPSHVAGTTPVPTTLGAATGEVSGKRSKVGFVIAGVLIVAAAVVGVVVVMNAKEDPQAAAPPATGSDVTEGSDGSAVVADPGSGSAGSAGSVGSAGSALGSAGSALGSAGSGSATVDKTATITIESDPAGAKIYVNGKEQKQRTPAALELPIGKTVKISLKASGHEELKLKEFVVKDDQKLLDNRLSRRTVQNTGSGQKGSGSTGKGSGKTGKGSDDDTGLERP